MFFINTSLKLVIKTRVSCVDVNVSEKKGEQKKKKNGKNHGNKAMIGFHKSNR
jgi:hypothetical protein